MVHPNPLKSILVITSIHMAGSKQPRTSRDYIMAVTEYY